MSKRPLNFENCSESVKKRSKKIFARHLSVVLGEETLTYDENESGHLLHDAARIYNQDTEDVTEIFHDALDGSESEIGDSISGKIPEHQHAEIDDDCAHEEFDICDEDNCVGCAETCCDTDEVDDDDDDPSNYLDEKIFAGSNTTIREFTLCVGLLKSSLNQPNTHTCRTLEFISTILPKPNRCPANYYQFKKILSRIEGLQLKKHAYCLDCSASTENTVHNPNTDESIESEENVEDITPCECAEKQGYFIEVPINAQLQAMYRRPGFFKKLMHKQSKLNDGLNGYRDIYDGSVQKELSAPDQILSFLQNISFEWYADGMLLFNSSKFAVWAFFLIILELPYKERFKLENIILALLWFGDKKPESNLFLAPLRKSLKQLYIGVEFYVQDLGRVILVRGVVTNGTADLPAKALILVMNQYNGRFGCQICIIEGLTIDRVRIYPYQQNLILRTEEETEIHAKQALESGKPVCGVKGPSEISKICRKYLKGTGIDPMHNVFEGTSKTLDDLWFDPKYAAESFNISGYVGLVDERLSSIKLPSYVKRRPEPIETHRAYWKASVRKVWFFYLSILCLDGILPDIYLEHFKLYVLAIYLLSREMVSTENINLAEILMQEFVSRFKHLYGERYQTCNLHSGLHLAEMVRRHGPMWTLSCFPLEALNGVLKNLVHSSKNPELQIVNNLDTYIKVHTLKHDWLQEDSDARVFYDKHLYGQKKMKLTRIDDNVHVVGAASRMSIDRVAELSADQDLQGSNIFLFKKLWMKGLKFSSQSAQKDSLKHEDHYVSYHHGSQTRYGLVEDYIRSTNCDCKKICECRGMTFARIKRIFTVQPYSVNIPGGSLNFIHECIKQCDEAELIEVQQLNDVLFHVQYNRDKSYVVEPVNHIEME